MYIELITNLEEFSINCKVNLNNPLFTDECPYLYKQNIGKTKQ